MSPEEENIDNIEISLISGSQDQMRKIKGRYQILYQSEQIRSSQEKSTETLHWYDYVLDFIDDVICELY